jgi:hypothetical protein
MKKFKQMNILFFTEISPFPINGGERIRSYGLLKSLSELGYKITAIIANSDNVDLANYKIKNVEYKEYKIPNKSKFDRITCLHYFKEDKQLVLLFNQIINDRKIDLAFLDYAFIGQYISFFKQKNIPVIYGTHNAQSFLTQQMPTKGLFRKLRKMQNVLMQKIHERIFFKKADQVIVVSNEDKELHSKFINPKKIQIIPNFLDETRYNADSYEKENYIVMTANFGAFMNFHGLKWFIEEVWNEELDTKLKFLIVGKKSKEALVEIKNSKLFKNIIAIGEVDNINPYISQAKAAVIPLLEGSGTRLKCIEAMALKTLVISTSKGGEGIQSSNVIINDSSIDFRKTLLNIDDITISEESLYNEFISSYSIQAVKPKLEKVIYKAIND